MRLILSMLLISAFGLAMQTCNKTTATKSANVRIETASPGVAANNAQTATQQTADDAPRISLADAKKAYDDGSAVIVDARGADSYKLEHIKGSINVPLADFEANYKKIPTDKKIIVYCS